MGINIDKNTRVFFGANAGFSGPCGFHGGITNSNGDASQTTKVSIGIPGWLLAFGISIYSWTTGNPVPAYA